MHEREFLIRWKHINRKQQLHIDIVDDGAGMRGLYMFWAIKIMHEQHKWTEFRCEFEW